ncbi:MAG: ribosome maturation factor RimP [Cyclobacteriaceae bacterium]
MELNEKIAEMTMAQLTNSSQFLVDVVITGNQAQRKILVVLDGDNGVTIEDCAKVSRAISSELDELDLIEGKFTLEVSTPGVDQPLKLKRQFKKNEGRGFKIVLKDKSILKGTLVAADESKVELESEEKVNKKKEVLRRSIPFDQIDKAFVQISFK